MKTQQIDMCEVTPEYQAFVDKFKPKLTTDDCLTPPNIYETVRDWVFEHYHLPKDTPVARPFWPGGDYERENYPDGCVVIDNPPFSILVKIERFYLDNGIRFFLFAPGLTVLKDMGGLKYVMAYNNITYANGAVVRTNFVTNLGEYLVETAPDLHERVEAWNTANLKKDKKEFPVYAYPCEVATAAKMGWLAENGVDFRVPVGAAKCVGKLDAQSANKKAIFGCGLLLGRQTAETYKDAIAKAERAKAAKAAKAERSKAAIVWELSDRERAIVDGLEG